MDALKQRWIVVFVTAVFTLSSMGCGTILYPERLNKQPSRKLDVKVVVLDCAWFLLCIWPGAVALGVDLVNDTIFLPKTEIEVETEGTEEAAVRMHGNPPAECILSLHVVDTEGNDLVKPTSLKASPDDTTSTVLRIKLPPDNAKMNSRLVLAVNDKKRASWALR